MIEAKLLGRINKACKKQTLGFLVCVFMPIFGLTQDRVFYQLQNKIRPNYTESSNLDIDSGWRFKHTLNYNEPNTFDEEHGTRLEIQIKDTALFLRKRRLDLLVDISAIKLNFTQWAIWNHNRDSTSITGHIQLLGITADGILLRLNLTITNLTSKSQYIYAGERLFYSFNKKRSVEELIQSMPSIRSN